MNEPEELITAYLEDALGEAERASLNAWLKADAANMRRFTEAVMLEEQIRSAAHAGAYQHAAADFDPTLMATSAPMKLRRRFQWRSLMAAAAAGLVIGLFSASVVFAYAKPKPPVVVTRQLPLADGDFESGAQVPAQGIPARADVWSGDFSRVVVAENGITPKQGQRMLRFLRSDNELSPKNERSYVGEVAQVIDLRPLRAELAGAEQLVEVAAQFNAIATPLGTRYEFAVKAAAFRGDILDAPRLWEDHEASVSRANRSVVADSDVATWQRVAVPLVVPPDADFLVIECAVVFKGPPAEQGVAEFPGHYVDQVEVRLNGSSRAWIEAHQAN